MNKFAKWYEPIGLTLLAIGMVCWAGIMLSGCGTIQKVLDPHRCDGAGYFTHMDCV